MKTLQKKSNQNCIFINLLQKTEYSMFPCENIIGCGGPDYCIKRVPFWQILVAQRAAHEAFMAELL